MIQTRVEKMSNGVIKQDLSVEGDTYSVLVKLVALSIGVLSAAKVQLGGLTITRYIMPYSIVGDTMNMIKDIADKGLWRNRDET